MKNKKPLKRCFSCQSFLLVSQIQTILAGGTIVPVIRTPPPASDTWNEGSNGQGAEIFARIAAFLDERMSVAFGRKIQAIVFYNEFADFWRVNHPGDEMPSNTSFGRNFKRIAKSNPLMAGIFKRKSNGCVFYQGIGLKDGR